MNEQPSILIVGASVRAAAESANAAGFQVYAADLFADRDLQSIATCHRVTDYPDEFANVQLQLQESHPRIPCIYTGAMENYPHLIQRLEAQGLVYGNSAETLRRVRDPFRLQTFFNQHKIPFPTTQHQPPPHETEWLRKSIRSAGGQHVRWDHSLGHDSPPRDESYYQQFVDGDVCSAAYIADRKTGHLLGVSDMLVGQQWLGCRGFVYCGSLVRIASNDELAAWRRLGELVAAEFQLIGAFGIDAIVRGNQLVPLEINPRYTASMELFEREAQDANAASATLFEQPTSSAAGGTVMRQHIAACRSKPVHVSSVSNQRQCGKAILYATDHVNIPESLNSTSACRLADIPSPGPIQNGYPILTLLARGTTRDELLDNLRAAAAHVYSQVRPSER